MRPFELEEALAERISSGELQAGERISDRSLARDHGVGRLGARQVLGSLSRRGLVELRDHHEAIVARPKVEQDLRAVAGFTEQMKAAGLERATKLLGAVVIAAPAKVAAALELDPSARVAQIQRLRFVSKVPLTLEEMYLPDELFPDIVGLGLQHSLYAIMRDCYARGPARSTERLEAVPARPHEAERLHVPVGSPLMLVERVAYDADGTPIEFTRDRHRGDRTQFVAETVPHVPG